MSRCNCGSERSNGTRSCAAAFNVLDTWVNNKVGGYGKAQWVCFENKWYRSRINANTRNPHDRTAWSEPFNFMALLNLIPDEDAPATVIPHTHACDEIKPCVEEHQHTHSHAHPHTHSHAHPHVPCPAVPFGGFAPGTTILPGEVFPAPPSCP